MNQLFSQQALDVISKPALENEDVAQNIIKIQNCLKKLDHSSDDVVSLDKALWVWFSFFIDKEKSIQNRIKEEKMLYEASKKSESLVGDDNERLRFLIKSMQVSVFLNMVFINVFRMIYMIMKKK